MRNLRPRDLKRFAKISQWILTPTLAHSACHYLKTIIVSTMGHYVFKPLVLAQKSLLVLVGGE